MNEYKNRGTNTQSQYTREDYPAVKRNAFVSVLMRWMNLEPIIQREISQKEKDKYHIY